MSNVEEMAEKLAGPKPASPNQDANSAQMRTAAIRHAQWSGKVEAYKDCLLALTADPAAIAAIVPEVSVVVPREASEAMIAAGEANNFEGDGFYDFASLHVWDAMIKASEDTV